MNRLFIFFLTVFFYINCQAQEDHSNYKQISGIYPHLAFYNSQGECGTGAVVPWAGRLWAITYSPHYPFGSDDKLYEITPELQKIIREESIGGTPANRMIHSESNQLFIGPYIIDSLGNVKAISYTEMPGRHTGTARHLFDPANKVYYGTMEEGFYEVDVVSGNPKMLYADTNKKKGRSASFKAEKFFAKLDGVHGKGLYSGQGVLVYSNNGEASPDAKDKFDIESGSLSEWDGKNWKTVRRDQFVEVTGPGGIRGNVNPETDPIWATGWDHKSVILGVRNAETGWDFYRLPKASHSYDGAHGWNTEWPRIRNIGSQKDPDYLMTMHGLFWRFPGGFSLNNSAGIRPRSAYLKVIGDFTRWNDQLVFGCDDSAQKEFLNKRKHKGGIEGPGQSNSNLWFTSFEKPDHLGPATASGSVWLNEEIEAKEYSEPFLFAGWQNRCAWIYNEGGKDVTFYFEIDKTGKDIYSLLTSVEVKAKSSRYIEFNTVEKGEWIRVSVNKATKASVSFNYSNKDVRKRIPNPKFQGLANVERTKSIGGLLYGLGNDRRALGVAAVSFENNEEFDKGYYELDEGLNLIRKQDPKTHSFIRERFAIPKEVINIQESSVLVVDDKGRRWRLPPGNKRYEGLTDKAQLRICREVATERDLFNCSGTFYELPAENADGFAKIRPVASHNYRIHDYASYRGMLVMTGIDPESEPTEHIILSDDGNAAVWAGAIDDLWELGKPVGKGGPWKDSLVKKGIPSDPYLIGFYDEKYLELSHQLNEVVKFKIEVEPVGHGPWILYKEVEVKPGEVFKHKFPDRFQARWIRFVSEKDCRSSAYLEYN